MANFKSLPPLPIGGAGLPPNVLNTINALLENVGMLTGERSNGSVAAVTKAAITVATPSEVALKSLSAKGSYIPLTVGTDVVEVVPRSEYVKLLSDVETLRSDVTKLRASHAALVKQLKG